MAQYSYAITCPQCGNPAEEQPTRYGIRHACRDCGLHSWGGKPLASPTTHEARKLAHEAFDSLWKYDPVRQGRLMKRGKAYKLLAADLGLTREECHMSIMDEETARRVPPAVERIKAQVEEADAPSR